jgi:3-dehydroquinate synthetase
VGPAVEAHGGYARWLHGEAVSLGTVAEMRATAALGWTPTTLVERAIALFASLGLPTEVDAAELAGSWSFVGSDKKRDGDAVKLPVVMAPGRADVKRVGLEALRHAVLRT